MGAKISKMFECPKCGIPLSHDKKPERCPGCKFRFAVPGEKLAKKFEWGKDPARQYFELVQQDMEKYLDKPIHEIVGEMSGKNFSEEEVEASKDMTLSNANRKKIIEQLRSKERDIFMMSSNPDDVEGWVKSIHYLMTLAIPSGNHELIQKLALWGMEIGKIGKALQDYLTAAGSINTYHQEILKKEIEKLKKELEEITNESDKSTPTGDSE